MEALPSSSTIVSAFVASEPLCLALLQRVQIRFPNSTPRLSRFTVSPRTHEETSLSALSLSKASSSRYPISIFPNNYSPSTVRINATIGLSSTADAASSSFSASENRHWMVIMERPSEEVLQSAEKIANYYVASLQRVLGSDKDALSCIYDISCDGTHFGFCCDVDEETSCALDGLAEVLLVKPDPDRNSVIKDYSFQLEGSRKSPNGRILLFPAGSSKHWLVRTDKPLDGVDTKAQMVNYYARMLTKVLGNERDAQMCIYHVSWQFDFGFCCELDEECAGELAGVPGVLSVEPDENFGSEIKDSGGDSLPRSTKSLNPSDSAEATQVKVKKLFITGLSFYTSEKTLRAAFEPFGELVEVKIIMDKISKRSKGYAFVEYTTEEAASMALKEMNGKIINGWMIVVDVAKTKARHNSRGRPKPTS